MLYDLGGTRMAQDFMAVSGPHSSERKVSPTSYRNNAGLRKGDAYFDTTAITTPSGSWTAWAPRSVLRKLYYQNALKLCRPAEAGLTR